MKRIIGLFFLSSIVIGVVLSAVEDLQTGGLNSESIWWIAGGISFIIFMLPTPLEDLAVTIMIFTVSILWMQGVERLAEGVDITPWHYWPVTLAVSLVLVTLIKSLGKNPHTRP